jgi:outer membrane protein assembly factor BamE (lipoprotein component of BamABCDE complex)
MKKILTALPLLLLLGCSTVVTQTEGTRIDKEQVLKIEPGTTTKQMVLDTFGNPTSVTSENGEEKLRYVFKEKRVPTYVKGLVENELASQEDTSTLEITLADGVVRSFRFKSSAGE